MVSKKHYKSYKVGETYCVQDSFFSSKRQIIRNKRRPFLLIEGGFSIGSVQGNHIDLLGGQDIFPRQ